MSSRSEKGSQARPLTTDETCEFTPDEAVDIPGYDLSIQYEGSEARKTLWKVDPLILPFIVLCFCFLQSDHTNIGNALTDTLRKDLNVGNSDINLAQTLFTVGFVITELLFNLISKYIGSERCLRITMVLWGIATWSQVFLKNAAGLCAARFFIGALEGGYIPGFALYISKYYTNQELALRYAIFWASNSFAGALGGPLAIGLLSLRGRGGLHGIMDGNGSFSLSLGFSGLQANGLNSVGSVCALVWSVSLAFSSDKFRERGFYNAVLY
ncbi:Fc.00g012180.m01.CDS01, partial [Cosmosporella sp. VM-42]